MQDNAARGHLYLVDGAGYLFRAYHALPPLSRPDGTPVNAVYGFCTMLEKLLDDLSGGDAPSHLAVVFDAARETFRNAIYPAYKAHRPEPPEDLVPQFALVRDASRAFNLSTIELRGFEADDVIATYAKQARAAGLAVTIVSSDKDLMQLVGEGVDMLDPIRQRRIGPAEVREKFGVGPERVVDVQSLAGDSADNVPGVPGIGVKTAAELIETYGDLDSLLAKADQIKQPKRRQSLLEHAAAARLSRELVRLRQDAPVPLPVAELTVRPRDLKQLSGFLEEQGFKSLIAKLHGRQSAGAPGAGNGQQAPAEAPIDRRDYQTVTSLQALDAWIAQARAAGTVCVDTETTSLDAMRAELVGVSLSVEPRRACYIPVGHRSSVAGSLAFGAGNLGPQLPLPELLARLKPLLADPTVLKVGQNLKYDALVLSRHGIEIGPLDDTMLISYVLEGGLHGHGMDELSERHLGVKPIAFKEVAGSGQTAVTFDLVPIDKATEYSAEDADITLRLHRLLKPRLLAERLVTVYETLERPLVPVLVEMERHGVKVDRSELGRLSADFAVRIGEIEQDVHRLAGERFNVGSPKQLGEILFDKLSLPGGKKGKTGAYATGAEVLEELAAAGHELPARVLDWRQLAKLKSTYTDALQLAINPQTGRVHTSFAMAATSTGRIASADPNLQNIPVRTEEGRRIRKAFVAEPGHVLLSADYSQIELRVLAHIADIAALKEAFRQGIDIHTLTASQVFGVPVEGIDPLLRRRAKAINFGIIYGISAFGLANNLGISQGEARAYIDAYFERYPGIRAYMERARVFCRQHGYVLTAFGRRCHMPGINDKNPARRGFQERAAINAPIQGTAADIIRRAMVRIPPALAEARLAARMLLQVHDELLFEVPLAQLDATARLVKQVMEGAAHLSLPLVVDIGSGADWEAAH
ncbi:MAG: DNA polymerase I [Alphaproteobacteria bacterium]|nr:DNA polymerase I [Alphaproteobacteria bacterium]